MKKIIISRIPTRDIVRGVSTAKIVDVIEGYPSVKSRASLILLNDGYRRQEAVALADMLNFSIDNAEFKKMSSYSLLQVMRKEFNKRFLDNSVLTCEYCKRKNLQRFGKKKPNKKAKHCFATVDHKIPLIDGPDWFDIGNLAVCCTTCNEKKQDIPYKEWCAVSI
jgi:5-methylcytosine-specific restriction endonuclease McrA